MIIFYKKSPMTAGQIYVLPQAGYTQQTQFQFYLSSCQYDLGSRIEAWIYIDTESSLLLSQQMPGNGVINYNIGKIPGWGIVNSVETKICTLSVTITSPSGESATTNATIQLTNNLTINTLGTLASSLAKTNVNSDQSALLISDALNSMFSNNPSGNLLNFSLATIICTKDDDCSFHGTCKVAQGNQNICFCKPGYTGQKCAYNKTILTGAMNMSTNIQRYVNSLLQNSSSGASIFTLASITSNLNQIRELVSPDLLENLGNYLNKTISNYDTPTITAMTNDQKNILIDGILESYDFSYSNSLNQIVESPTANNSLLRYNISIELQSAKTTFYDFISKIGQSLPLNTTFNFSSLKCDGKIGQFFISDLASTNFTQSSYFALNSSGVSFSIPPSLFTNNASTALKNTNITNVRMLHWKGNPYVFAKTASQVQSDVVSFSLLNDTNDEININGLIDPITINIQLSAYTATRKDLACSYFNYSAEEVVTYQEYDDVNVSQLNMTDAQKKLYYPEWDPALYKNNPLIVKVLVTKNDTRVIGDFKTDGCQLVGITNSSAICQCNHLSDFAIISETVPNSSTGSDEVPIPSLPGNPSPNSIVCLS